MLSVQQQRWRTTGFNSNRETEFRAKLADRRKYLKALSYSHVFWNINSNQNWISATFYPNNFDIENRELISSQLWIVLKLLQRTVIIFILQHLIHCEMWKFSFPYVFCEFLSSFGGSYVLVAECLVQRKEIRNSYSIDSGSRKFHVIFLPS